ncbi:MAG: hypothetical protein ACK4TF_01770 [Thermodesulfovibrionales bacterium]
MRYRDALKQGIDRINKNYQLLFVQIGALIITFFLFILVVGVPLIIVFTKTGIEFPENGFKGLTELIFKEGGLSAYLSIVITVILSLSLYIIIASTIFIYAIAGTSGVIMYSISGRENYSWRLFTGLGRKLFKRFLLLSILGLLMLIMISFLAGLFSGLTKVGTSISGGLLRDFLRNFLNLLSILISLGAVIFFMAIFTYAAGFMILKEEKTLAALKDSFDFVIGRPDALVFYSLLSIGAIILTISFGFLGTFFKSLSGLALYQLILSIIQIYINLSVLSSAFVYLYDRATGQR